MKWHVAALAALLIVGCGKQQEETYQPTFSPRGADKPREYIVGIHPLHNPQHLVEVYGPVVDYLNVTIPQAHFRLEASRNYEEFEKKLYSGHFDFAMPNSYQTVRSLKNDYRVFAKMGNDEMFRGIILVRKDSGIRTVADLKGKKVSYPALTALAATMMPQYYLHTHGIDVNRDIENLYVGSQESSIMNVYLGNVAAGGTFPLPWEAFQKEHPGKARELELKWETESMINQGVVARDDVPEKLASRVAQLLDTLHTTNEGKAILARMPLSRFELADDKSYRVVQDFLRKFSEKVYPLDKPEK